MVYQLSSATSDIYPLVGVAGKNVNDNSGVVGDTHTLEQGESAYVENTGSNFQEYGDYLAVANDLSADKSFALYAQYPEDSSTNANQAMRLGNVEYK